MDKRSSVLSSMKTEKHRLNTKITTIKLGFEPDAVLSSQATKFHKIQNMPTIAYLEQLRPSNLKGSSGNRKGSRSSVYFENSSGSPGPRDERNMSPEFQEERKSKLSNSTIENSNSQISKVHNTSIKNVEAHALDPRN